MKYIRCDGKNGRPGSDGKNGKPESDGKPGSDGKIIPFSPIPHHIFDYFAVNL